MENPVAPDTAVITAENNELRVTSVVSDAVRSYDAVT
jgi:hypothetical protein